MYKLKNYKDLLDLFDKKFPEYPVMNIYDLQNRDLAYIYIGSFATNAFDNLDSKTDFSLAERLVIFANDIINDPETDIEIKNLVQIEIFEPMAGSKRGALLAREHLKGEAKEGLKVTLRGFGSPEFMEQYHKDNLV